MGRMNELSIERAEYARSLSASLKQPVRIIETNDPTVWLFMLADGKTVSHTIHPIPEELE